MICVDLFRLNQPLFLGNLVSYFAPKIIGATMISAPNNYNVSIIEDKQTTAAVQTNSTQ